MNQEWFEMPEIRRRALKEAVRIPLRAIHQIEKVGKYGYEGYKEEMYCVGSVAFPLGDKAEVEKLGWSEIGIAASHAGYIQDKEYIPCNVYQHYGDSPVGEHLVLDQRGNSIEPAVWHLSQDFVTTLGLKREGNVWVRPEEGYIEVARIHEKEDGSPYLLEVRASHLRDYLCAREMGLYITSYRDRVEIVSDASHFAWPDNPATYKDGMDRWEGRIGEIHEGGNPFGESMAVFHVGRTDVDAEEDVPNYQFPTDDNVESKRWTKKFEGKKLFMIEGELWRNEWIAPASSSPIIRGDRMPPTVFFVTDAEGKQESRDTLASGSRWLWFRPDVVMDLAHRRGGLLGWYTRYTGSVGCSPGHNVHFGINRIGLLNVYAKDIGQLPDWQQKIWAGYNVSPDGKVSEELLASQMKAEPASTKAPEAFLADGLSALNEITYGELGIRILRDHEHIPKILNVTHRFRAINKEGIYALAKDVARLTADSIDATAIQGIVPSPKGEKWASLKSLEKLLASKIDPNAARSVVGPLVGAYELRHGDAHLPSSELDTAFSLLQVNQSDPFVHQGCQMLVSTVTSIYTIIDVIKQWNKPS